MTLNTLAVANQIVVVLQALSGPALGNVQIGVPEHAGARVEAYVTIGSQPMVKKNTGTVQRSAHYFVTFAYRLDAGNVTTAETDLMALVDNFQAALNADLTLAHTCDGIDIDTGLADAPDYRMFAGKEYREYPCIIIARQTGAFNPAP